jgi:hypothetical protein
VNKLSKSQISLMKTLESVIQTEYFKNLMTQELIPPSIKLINLSNSDNGEQIQRVTLKSPGIDDFNIEEKELLFWLIYQIGNLDYPSDSLIINTTKDDFLNLLAFVIRQSRFS